MASTPLVSIVIPVLRDTRELEQLIEMLGRRSSADEGPQVEVIVVNGDPSDPTLEPLRRTCPGIQWTESAPGRAWEPARGRWAWSGRDLATYAILSGHAVPPG